METAMLIRRSSGSRAVVVSLAFVMLMACGCRSVGVQSAEPIQEKSLEEQLAEIEQKIRERDAKRLAAVMAGSQVWNAWVAAGYGAEVTPPEQRVRAVPLPVFQLTSAALWPPLAEKPFDPTGLLFDEVEERIGVHTWKLSGEFVPGISLDPAALAEELGFSLTYDDVSFGIARETSYGSPPGLALRDPNWRFPEDYHQRWWVARRSFSMNATAPDQRYISVEISVCASEAMAVHELVRAIRPLAWNPNASAYTGYGFASVYHGWRECVHRAAPFLGTNAVLSSASDPSAILFHRGNVVVRVSGPSHGDPSKPTALSVAKIIDARLIARGTTDAAGFEAMRPRISLKLSRDVLQDTWHPEGIGGWAGSADAVLTVNATPCLGGELAPMRCYLADGRILFDGESSTTRPSDSTTEIAIQARPNSAGPDTIIVAELDTKHFIPAVATIDIRVEPRKAK